MAGVGEEHRGRIATALMLVGAGLILTGVALVFQHRHQVAASQNPFGQASPDQNLLLAYAMRQILFWLLILVGVFSISTFAFLRWSRRFRDRLLRRPRPPTRAEDVWAMHRLPDEPETAEPPGPETGG